MRKEVVAREPGACVVLTRDCEAIQIPDGERITVLEQENEREDRSC